jgi:phosphatidate cytidylyltransferase
VLRERLLTAVVGLPIILGVVVLGGVPFAAVLAALLAAGCVELCQACGLGARRPETVLAAALTGALVPAVYAHADVRSGLLVAAVVAPLLVAIWRADVEPDSGLPGWLVVPAAVLYVGWLGQHLLLVRRLHDGLGWTLVLLLATFATDTGAYAAGRLLGRHKLAPRVSPAKTVEGAVGGLVFAVAAVVALDYLLDLPQRLPMMLVLGVAVGASAELGDLAESVIKRRLGVKDMGHLFPGHGGVLDRLDSLLFVAPVLYYFVRWAIM